MNGFAGDGRWRWGTRLLVNAAIDDNRQGLESHSSLAARAQPAPDIGLSQGEAPRGQATQGRGTQGQATQGQATQGQMTRATYLKSK
jgi:hypothetical protein